MKLESLRQSLMCAARLAPPSDHVPFAFEQRVLATLRSLRNDPLGEWATGLWRAALCSVAVALMAGLWLGRPLSPTRDPPGGVPDGELGEAASADFPDTDPSSSW